MRIAYLTTSYPSVSHTFIRRELLEVERQVGPIARFAVRPTPYAIVDAEDASEAGQTYCLLVQPKTTWLRALMRGVVARPLAAGHGLRKALDLGRASHRGMARHAAYFLEAVLLRDELARRGIEHVHVHFGTNPTAVAQIVRAMGGPSYSFTVHGPDEFDAPEALKLRSKVHDASFVVAITDFTGGQLRRWVPHDEWEKIRVVHCSVGDEFFQGARLTDPASKTLVCVGRLAPQKGQLLLLTAFADAVARGVDARLVFAGDGEMRGEMERIIAERDLTDRVRITGWIDGEQVRAEILAARALVMASFAEGLPMVLMEAFALGRTVVATNIAGIAELVTHRENGWLVSSGSEGALSEAIVELMRTPVEELDRMAAKGREAVRSRHFTEVEASRLVGHLRDVVGGGREEPGFSAKGTRHE